MQFISKTGHGELVESMDRRSYFDKSDMDEMDAVKFMSQWVKSKNRTQRSQREDAEAVREKILLFVFLCELYFETHLSLRSAFLFEFPRRNIVGSIALRA